MPAPKKYGKGGGDKNRYHTSGDESEGENERKRAAKNEMERNRQAEKRGQV